MSKQTIKANDKVKIKSEDTFGIITDIQHGHNRYQLLGVSGWQSNIDNLEKVTDEQFLEGYKEIEEILTTLTMWHNREVNRLQSELKQSQNQYNILSQAIRDGNTPNETAAGLIAWLESTTSFELDSTE